MALREHPIPSVADCRCPVPSGDHGAPPAPGGLEDRYEAAKARLLAAQQEKVEATVEFLAARAAVRRRLESVWAGGDEPLGWVAAGV